ncbi:MAG: RDD family protein [Planctomycetaceae bacterium]
MRGSENNPMGSDPFNPYAAPENIDYAIAAPGESELATLSERFSGASLDGLLMLPVVFGVVFGYTFFSVEQGGIPASMSRGAEIVGTLIGLVVGLAWYLILNGYLLAKRGQTIGKLAAGTRIVDFNTGELVPLIPLLLKRNLVIQILGAVPFVGGFVSLADVLMIFRSSRRCLHDDIAGTKVIKVRKIV